MKGDFSRYRFDPAKHYSAVLEQQGRVQLDADANEQRAIDWHRLATETIDVIGATGAPRHAAGFAISLRSDNRSLLIDPGRYYINGLLCEAATQTDYTQQPWLIDQRSGIDAMLAALRVGRASAVRVWLEAWQRLVTPIDDPCIKDPALGEADTTVRVQTVWRVVAEPIAAATNTNLPDIRRAVDTLRQSLALHQQATQSTALQAITTRADTLATDAAGSGASAARLAPELVALRAAGATALSRLSRAPGDTGARLTAALDTVGRIGGAFEQQSCCDAMRKPPLALLPGMMTASTDDATGQGPCLPSPQAAYRGLENQLYRVEVHQGGPLASATFKWSRENGSVLTRIVHVSGAVLTVDSLGPDANLGFAPLQWVEISDDSDMFGQPPNQPGQLRQIKSVDFEHRRVTLTSPAPAVDTENGHAKLRRWDHADADATEAGIAMAPGGWHSLENGIRVQFSDARPFVAGDYWLVPARTATGALEWPPCGGDGADFQPAHNTRIHRAPLACIHFDARLGGFVAEDCRDLFSPLTELTPPATPAALHVVAINWPNDDIVALDQVQSNGLSVTFDGPPAPGIDAATFTVLLEAPLFTASSDAGFNTLAAAQGNVALALRLALIIDGSLAINGNAILWAMPRRLTAELAQLMQALESFVDRGVFARVRVALKGRAIRGAGAGAPIYLDGQSFGVPATRTDGKTARTDLSLPSGYAAKASDFESWFYLVPSQRVISVTVTPPAVTWVQVGVLGNSVLLRLVDPTTTQAVVSPTLTFALAYNAPADTVVTLTVSGGTTGIVTVPATVTVPRGSKSPAQPVAITVGNTGVASTEIYTIAVSVPLAGGTTTTDTATLTVTGHPGGGIRIPPVIFTGGPGSVGNLFRARDTSSVAGGHG
jgi:hypothetical protein